MPIYKIQQNRSLDEFETENVYDSRDNIVEKCVSRILNRAVDPNQVMEKITRSNGLANKILVAHWVGFKQHDNVLLPIDVHEPYRKGEVLFKYIDDWDKQYDDELDEIIKYIPEIKFANEFDKFRFVLSSS